MFESVLGSVYANTRYHGSNCRDAIFCVSSIVKTHGRASLCESESFPDCTNAIFCVSTLTNYANITFSAEKNPFECKNFFRYANRLRSGILTLHRESSIRVVGWGATRRKCNLIN